MIYSTLKLFGGDKLVEDYVRWVSLRNKGFWNLFIFFPEFRYQFYYRLRNHSRILLMR